uniref:Fibroin heavy chain-like n=1 Tax=Ascaris lumbricoides TaxID=6252 RepID=A0A0M3HN76_ASCLU
MNIEMGLGVLFSTTCAFLVLCGCGVDAYATRSGYARPADLFGGENGRSGSAFGASESVQAQTAASYARPASVTANGGGYQPISGANGYSYGNGGYANSQYPAAGNGKRKPVGFGGEANGVGYGGYTSAPSGYPAAGSYAGGAAAPSYARPASVPFSGGEHNGAQGPSVPANGAQYPSYPSDTYESGTGMMRPYEGNGHAPSDRTAGCTAQESVTSGCPSGGGAQFPSRAGDGYGDGGITAHPSPYDENGQFGGNGHSSDYHESAPPSSTFEGNGHEGDRQPTGCNGAGGGDYGSGGCEQGASRVANGIPKAPSTSFSRPVSSGFGDTSGQSVSAAYSDYAGNGYTQQRSDDSYRSAANGRTPQREGSYGRTSGSANGAPAYPSTGTDYSQSASGYTASNGNGNGYYDSARAKDYSGSGSSASYARPADVTGPNGGYAGTTPARDSYPAATASYSRPSALSASSAASVSDYTRPGYDTSSRVPSANGANGYEYPQRGAPAYDATAGSRSRGAYPSVSNGGYAQVNASFLSL